MKNAIALAAAAILASVPAWGDTLTVTAMRDNTLIEKNDGSLSNGIGEHFFAGRTGQGTDEDQRRGLVRFDVSAIPAGSTVTAVQFRLYLSRDSQDAGVRQVTVHRVLADWGEGPSMASGQEGAGDSAEPGDATWLHRFYPSQFWTTPGGDYAGAGSASLMVGDNGLYAWTGATLVSDVQAWVGNGAANFGWMIRGDESTSKTAKRFDTRENSNASRRPQLVVTFTPPAMTGACCLPTACAVLTASECSAQGGTYQGNGVPCVPSPCPPATGACCASGAACQVQTQAACATAGGTYQGDYTTCTPNPCPLGLTPFVDALPIPALAQPVTGVPGGEASYVIPIQQVQQQLHRDLPPTTVWGYAGSYPGPTILAYRDRPVTVTWVNDLRYSEGNYRTQHYLPVDTCLHGPDMAGATCRVVTHLHGGHVPPESDGYPEATLLPGEQVTYVYPNNQGAGTIWYHDHALGITRLNVYMGMAGFYVIRDDAEAALNLPAGEFDIGLAVQDRSFNLDGSLKYQQSWEEHFFGDYIVVNGKVWPYLNVKQGKYRFRILGGSTSRVYRLALSNGATFWQIGTDGGLIAHPVAMSELVVNPGERAEVIVDFALYTAGTEIILTNSAPSPFPGGGMGPDLPDVMKFIVTGEPGDTDPIPPDLRPMTPLLEIDATENRDLVLRKIPDACTGQRWAINGLGWHDITEMPRLGDTEVWSFINRSGTVHPMHMHLVFFQVLDRQDIDVVDDVVVPVGPRVPPPPGETGWKDTVAAYPQEITRVIARFDDYTGKYPYHCHILEHEDHEMMRQFMVMPRCGSPDFDGDGDTGTDSDIEAFFACLGGACCATCGSADFDFDGDTGTDADIEAFFRVLGGGNC